jgi:hypothetical protein
MNPEITALLDRAERILLTSHATERDVELARVLRVRAEALLEGECRAPRAVGDYREVATAAAGGAWPVGSTRAGPSAVGHAPPGHPPSRVPEPAGLNPALLGAAIGGAAALGIGDGGCGGG